MVSKDLDKFTFTFLDVDSTKLRDYTDSEDLTATPLQGAYSATFPSDRLYYAGIEYRPLKNLTLSLHARRLEDLFQRNFAGSNSILRWGRVKCSPSGVISLRRRRS